MGEAIPSPSIGEKLRVTIASKEVSISLQKPTQSSIRNVLKGNVWKIETHLERVDLAIQVENQQIWSTISLWSFNELAIQPGQEVYLQIKSVSL